MTEQVRMWLLRHAESENVVAGTAGAVPSATLTGRGVDQAAAAGRRLAAEPLAAVYASTATRAVQTAEAIAAPHGLVVIRDPGLAEVGIGRFEGSRDPAVRRRTAAVLRAWVVDRDLDQRVGDGESGHEVLGRMSAALETIAEAHRGAAVAVVGHVAALTVTLAELYGLGSSVWGEPLPHAEPFLIAGEHTGRAPR